MEITARYLPVLALVFVFRSFRMLMLRRKLRTAIGDGRNVTLRRAIMVHANFTECVPIALLLIYCLTEKTGY